MVSVPLFLHGSVLVATLVATDILHAWSGTTRLVTVLQDLRRSLVVSSFLHVRFPESMSSRSVLHAAWRVWVLAVCNHRCVNTLAGTLLNLYAQQQVTRFFSLRLTGRQTDHRSRRNANCPPATRHSNASSSICYNVSTISIYNAHPPALPKQLQTLLCTCCIATRSHHPRVHSRVCSRAWKNLHLQPPIVPSCPLCCRMRWPSASILAMPPERRRACAASLSCPRHNLCRSFSSGACHELLHTLQVVALGRRGPP